MPTNGDHLDVDQDDRSQSTTSSQGKSEDYMDSFIFPLVYMYLHFSWCALYIIWSNPTKWTHFGVLSATVGGSHCCII